MVPFKSARNAVAGAMRRLDPPAGDGTDAGPLRFAAYAWGAVFEDAIDSPTGDRRNDDENETMTKTKNDENEKRKRVFAVSGGRGPPGTRRRGDDVWRSQREFKASSPRVSGSTPCPRSRRGTACGPPRAHETSRARGRKRFFFVKRRRGRRNGMKKTDAPRAFSERREAPGNENKKNKKYPSSTPWTASCTKWTTCRYSAGSRGRARAPVGHRAQVPGGHRGDHARGHRGAGGAHRRADPGGGAASARRAGRRLREPRDAAQLPRPRAENCTAPPGGACSWSAGDVIPRVVGVADSVEDSAEDAFTKEKDAPPYRPPTSCPSCAPRRCARRRSSRRAVLKPRRRCCGARAACGAPRRRWSASRTSSPATRWTFPGSRRRRSPRCSPRGSLSRPRTCSRSERGSIARRRRVRPARRDGAGDSRALAVAGLRARAGTLKRSATKLFDALDDVKTRGVPLRRFLFALGIRGVGRETAAALAKTFGTLEAFRPRRRRRSAI